MKKTLIICVWFGRYPGFLPFFLKTVTHNPAFSWLIVSDQDSIPRVPENVRIHPCTYDRFNAIASTALGFRVNLTNARKLCDFKPAYGLIFREHLRGFDYWGYGDLDIILGNLGSVTNHLLLKNTDVISFYEGFLSGPLCIFRNCEETLSLFKQIDPYEKILKDPPHYAMDENNTRRNPDRNNCADAWLKTGYFVSHLFNLNVFRHSLAETRYRYQWYLKKRTCGKHPPYDMTDAVCQQMKMNGLRVSFQDLIVSDSSLRRAGNKNWRIHWQNGRLRHINSGKEIPVFHFKDLKHRLNFKGLDISEIPNNFILDRDGFHL